MVDSRNTHVNTERRSSSTRHFNKILSDVVPMKNGHIFPSLNTTTNFNSAHKETSNGEIRDLNTEVKSDNGNRSQFSGNPSRKGNQLVDTNHVSDRQRRMTLADDEQTCIARRRTSAKSIIEKTSTEQDAVDVATKLESIVNEEKLMLSQGVDSLMKYNSTLLRRASDLENVRRGSQNSLLRSDTLAWQEARDQGNSFDASLRLLDHDTRKILKEVDDSPDPSRMLPATIEHGQFTPANREMSKSELHAIYQDLNKRFDDKSFRREIESKEEHLTQNKSKEVIRSLVGKWVEKLTSDIKCSLHRRSFAGSEGIGGRPSENEIRGEKMTHHGQKRVNRDSLTPETSMDLHRKSAITAPVSRSGGTPDNFERYSPKLSKRRASEGWALRRNKADYDANIANGRRMTLSINANEGRNYDERPCDFRTSDTNTIFAESIRRPHRGLAGYYNFHVFNK